MLGNPETGESYSIVEACRVADVARSTYYEWVNNVPEFAEYMDYIADQALKSRIGKYDRILDRIAEGDNPKLAIEAINILFKRIGKYKNELTANVNMNENKDIADKSLDELDEQLRKLREQLKSESDTGSS